MIHYFSISNFSSVREKATLDFRIPRTAPDLPHFRKSRVNPNIRLPSVVVLTGPNGSGKTTLLRALVEAMQFALTPWTADQKPIQVFRPFFAEQFQNQPMQFCVEFEADWLAPDSPWDLFRYQFSAGYGQGPERSNTIISEALFHFPKGRPRRLFERGKSDEPIYVSGEFGIKPKDDRLRAVRSDASVLSTLALLNVPLAMRIAESIQLSLMATNIVYHSSWTLSSENVIEVLERNPDMKQWVERAMQGSDLAIQGMNIVNDTRGKPFVVFPHRGLDAPVLLSFESGGTKRLFHLLPQIHVALQNGASAILDEVDGDLHVDIVGEIFRRFRSRESNPHNAQLLVTSHNVGLFDDLEKEEIFIVEKGGDSGTRVHGVQDVRGVRRDTKLYPKYRAGALGGLPKLG